MATEEEHVEGVPLARKLPEKFAIPRGGPLGLGDPDDTRLRKVEADIVIKDKVREAAKELCKNFIQKFSECAIEAGMATPWNCRMENKAQIECISYWFHEEELNKKMTEEYLRERSEYRRTGIRPVRKKANINPISNDKEETNNV